MIRRAHNADAASLARLHAAAFTPGWTVESFKALLTDPSTLALMDDKEAGFILLRVAADEGEVLTFGVAPEARRTGLGRALLRRARDEAPGLGASTLFLEVAADNAAALALYVSEGFQEVGRRPAYYGRPHGAGMDAALLRLALSAAA